VPNLRTMVTELGTGLGMLGHDDLDRVLATRPAAMRSLSPEDWDQLAMVRAGGLYDAEFHAAWENGRAFLAAQDGLRGRLPVAVEWKGAVRAAGDEVAPVDLRIDHVYLISCKYLSNILFNVSPAHVFDDLLVGGQSRRARGRSGNGTQLASGTSDWFAEVAPDHYQYLYDIVRQEADTAGSAESATERAIHASRPTSAPSLPGLGPTESTGTRGAPVERHSADELRHLPMRAVDLTSAQRVALGRFLSSGWPAEAKTAYGELSNAVATASVARWRTALSGGASAAEAMLWRLLRMGSTPYFVLGSSATRSLRLRIATPWDWRQLYTLTRLEIFPQEGGQARVGWIAHVRERASGHQHDLAGHVEVRWSHGRFGGPPEAKGYIDTPHHLVPGYFPLL
jgi:hypothetical protein